ncbi:MAG TPA: hypothetical protein VFC19_32275 [Candidatus Limnocylindrales bacterium]|nr:hypothetical protein [Candidatus Limnocylindrales bacterium]
MTGLEHHYRRLIALYPAAHRQRYQMEMLSTLMDGASENQRAPGFRETIDLVWNAIWLRVNRDGRPLVRDPRWASAAAIFGVLGAITIAGLQVMLPLGEMGWQQRLAEIRMPHSQTSWIPFAQGAAWLAVAVIALLGRRRIAAIAGWATVLVTLAGALSVYRADPTVVVREWTLMVFGVVVAGGLTLAKGRMALRAMHVAVFGGVAAACAVSLWVDAMLAYVQVHPGGGVGVMHWGVSFPSLPGINVGGMVPLGLFAMFLAVSVWLQYTVDAGVRWRLRAYAWVPLFTWVLVSSSYSGYLAGSMTQGLNVAQWLALVLVPLVAFGVGVILVRRRDSRERLIEIGRAHS